MSRILDWSFNLHCFAAFCVRAALVAYGNYQDRHFSIPYTDVDYKVFTDAARFVANGGSPYERHTYRYSPLLALLLVPNVVLHQDYGKLLFCVADILVAALIKTTLERQSCDSRIAKFCSLLWLYNPLTIVISTRGNADSLAVLLVIGTLHLVQRDMCTWAGLLHGLSIHFRLYPIAFSLPMYLTLQGRANNSWPVIPNLKQCKLAASCVLSLAALTAASYHFYGYEFLHESVLYHLTRKDARHNFSVYFYMLYLTADQEPNNLQRALTFLPQLILLLALSCISYSRKPTLAFAMFSQAMVMVTYNPVMTSQYFFWFLSLLPLCLPDMRATISLKRSIALGGFWALSQVFWLVAAFSLEFKSVNTFESIWIAGIVFYISNICALIEFINIYTPPKRHIE